MKQFFRQSGFALSMALVVLVVGLCPPQVVAQSEQNDSDLLSGVQESIQQGASELLFNQVAELCSAVALASELALSVEAFGSTLDNIFLQPFIDLQRTSCYRTIIWEIDDAIDELSMQYGQVNAQICVEQNRIDIMKDTSNEGVLANLRAERGRLYDSVRSMRSGLSLYREFGSKGTELTADNKKDIYGYSDFSDALYREIFAISRNAGDHPYYCPYFLNKNIIGVELEDPDWNPVYVVTGVQENEKEKRKRVLDSCVVKWSAMSASVSTFLDSPDTSSGYPLFSALDSQVQAAIKDQLRSFLVLVPYLQKRVHMCTNSVIGDFVDTFEKIFSIESIEQLFTGFKERLQKRIREAKMATYDRICNRIIETRKAVGGTLHDLPYFGEINGVAYCQRPNKANTTFRQALERGLQKSINSLVPPKGLSEIAVADLDATMQNVMSVQLDEWTLYQFQVDIAKQRAMYQALYEEGSDGVTTSLRDVMSEFLNILRTTVSADPAKKGNDAFPVTKAIWDVFYDLQDRQQCGSCSVQQDDLKISQPEKK